MNSVYQVARNQEENFNKINSANPSIPSKPSTNTGTQTSSSPASTSFSPSGPTESTDQLNSSKSESQSSDTPPTTPAPPGASSEPTHTQLPPDPPKLSKRRSLLGAPPLSRTSLLGQPPTLRRTPGLPSPLSVFFCNLHGRPRKFERKSSNKEKFHNNVATQVFTNGTKEFSRCTPDDLRKFSTTSARNIISAIISDIIDNIDVT